MGANYFLLEWISFQKGFGVKESKQEVTVVIYLVKQMAEKYQVYLVLN